MAEIDVLVAFIMPENLWYVVPIAAFVSQIYLPVVLSGATFVGAVLLARGGVPRAALVAVPVLVAAWLTRRLARRLEPAP